MQNTDIMNALRISSLNEEEIKKLFETITLEELSVSPIDIQEVIQIFHSVLKIKRETTHFVFALDYDKCTSPFVNEAYIRSLQITGETPKLFTQNHHLLLKTRFLIAHCPNLANIGVTSASMRNRLDSEILSVKERGESIPSLVAFETAAAELKYAVEQLLEKHGNTRTIKVSFDPFILGDMVNNSGMIALEVGRSLEMLKSNEGEFFGDIGFLDHWKFLILYCKAHRCAMLSGSDAVIGLDYYDDMPQHIIANIQSIPADLLPTTVTLYLSQCVNNKYKTHIGKIQGSGVTDFDYPQTTFLFKDSRLMYCDSGNSNGHWPFIHLNNVIALNEIVQKRDENHKHPGTHKIPLLQSFLESYSQSIYKNFAKYTNQQITLDVAEAALDKTICSELEKLNSMVLRLSRSEVSFFAANTGNENSIAQCAQEDIFYGRKR